MAASLESRLKIESIVLGLTYTETSGTATTPAYKATTTFDGAITYQRVRPADHRRWCGYIDQAGLTAALLKPGEFYVDGSCCCRCFHTVHLKAAAPFPGWETSFEELPGIDYAGAPIPDTVKQSLTATPFITFNYCSEGRISSWFPASGTSVPVSIQITQAVVGTAKRNAEQVIRFTSPRGGIAGSATLSWTAPDFTVYPIVLNGGWVTGAGPNIGDLIQQAMNAGLPAGVIVTNEGEGFRLGFTGKYGLQPVNPVIIAEDPMTHAKLNTLGSTPLAATPAVFPSGPPVAEAFGTVFMLGSTQVAEVSGSNKTACGTAFSAKKAFTAPPDLLDPIFSKHWAATFTAE